MPISQANQVDYLFKKIGYSITTTANASVKSPSNESIPSPLTLRGDTIWAQSSAIPSTPPGSSSGVVSIYSDANTNSVKTTNDSTSPSNQTWKTQLTNWIDPSFGSTYAVKVYLDSTSSTTPQTTGTQLFPDGTGNDDEWFFDYDSGVLTFPDMVPTVVSSSSGETIFIVGARYTGPTGLSNAAPLMVGTISTSNISMYSNVAVTSANATYYPVLVNSTTGNLVDYTASTLTFNPNTGNLIVGNVSAALHTGNIMGQTGNIGSLVVGNLTVSGGSLTGLSNVSSTAATFTSANTSTITATLANIVTANVFTLVTGSVYSTFYGNIYGTYFVANTSSPNINFITGANGIITMENALALTLPTGGNISRPASPTVGQIRYNTDEASVEYYTGESWFTLNPTVTSQTFSGGEIGSGGQSTYTLNNPTTAAGVIVSINGVIQLPGTSYTVTGDLLTFNEAPLVTDIIDVRFLAAGAAPKFNQVVVDPTSIPVGTNPTIIDFWNSSLYRSAKYTISSTGLSDATLSEVNLIQFNGVIYANTISVINTGANTISYTANINGSTVNLIATASQPYNQVTYQVTYFTG